MIEKTEDATGIFTEFLQKTCLFNGLFNPFFISF